MKKILLYTLLLWGAIFTFGSCDVDIPEIEKPVLPEKDSSSQPDDEDDPSADPNGIFDYSKIGEHPRLFLNAQDFDHLKQEITNNSTLKIIHEIIINRCNKEFVGASTLTYQKSGKRLLTVSRKALERICHLAYGYRMNNDYTYLNQAEKDIRSVCSFPDWNPTHYLDIGEMALAVAIGLDWLYNDLQPETRKMAQTALENYAFKTATDPTYSKQFIETTTNWNQVCNGGLLAAALVTYEKDKSRAVEIIEQSFNSNKTKGMTTYGTDGNYPEGYMYWGYGTTYQVILIAALEKVFNTDNGLSQTSAGFLKTAEYMLFMAGTTGKCFNYSDCTEPEEPKLPMWWFAKKQGHSSLLFNELRLLKKGAYASKFEERRLLPIIMGFIDSEQVKETISAPQKKLWWGDGDTPVVLIHTDWTYSDTDKYFGMKGGRSNTSHGHMDGATFVYDAYGERWAMDLGMQEYAPLEAAGIDLWNSSQSSTRWSIFRLNNFSHNVITINNNQYHYQGKAFVRTDYMKAIGTKLGAKFECFGVNRNGNDYDVDAPVRTAEFIDNGGDLELVIKDEIKSRANKTPLVRWAMATPATAEIISNHCIKLSQNGKILYLTVQEQNNHPFTLKTWPASTDNKYDEANPGVTMVGFEAQMSAKDTRVFTTTFAKEPKNFN